MELHHARMFPLTVVEAGHVATLQQIWPVDQQPQDMFKRAARGGHMGMLRFLLDKHPQEQLGEHLAYLAAKHDHLEILRFLMASDWAMIPKPLAGANGRCLVALTEAGRN